MMLNELSSVEHIVMMNHHGDDTHDVLPFL